MKKWLINFAEKHPVLWQGLIITSFVVIMGLLTYSAILLDNILNELITQ